MSGQRHKDEWHPDATALAEYRAGLADGRLGRRVAAHVAGCARCASVNDQLAAVTSALASAPAPPLPDAVERRITAALAAEAALTAEASPVAEAAPAAAAGPRPSRGDSSGPSRGDSSGPSRGDGSGPPRRARGIRGVRRVRPAVLVSSAAAAACLVVIGVVFLLGLVHFSSGSSSSSAASRPAPASARAAAPAVSAFAGRATAGGHAVGSAGKAPFAVSASGIRYEPATLAAQVQAQLAAKNVGATLPAPASAHLASPGSASYSTLAACVLRLTSGVQPSLVDSATYQGKPVYVIAVTDRAWVVGRDCTASDSHLITSIGL